MYEELRARFENGFQPESGRGDGRARWCIHYERSRRRHIIRPLNYYCNRGELEDCIYWRFGDVALVLYDLVFETDDDCTTMKISREMTEEWGVSDEILLNNALLNTCAKMPPRLFYGDDLRYRCKAESGIFMPGEGSVNMTLGGNSEREAMLGYRLTTTRRINGAVALFYPHVKERLAGMMQGDFYVGFPSIHEAVIHPVRYKVLSGMKAAIYHTNLVFDERELLTNRVYRYMSSRQELLEV